MQTGVRATLAQKNLCPDFKDGGFFIRAECCRIVFVAPERLFLPPIREIMDDLKVSLKQQIIDSLNLQGMKPEDIDDNAPLFGEGLGLDSIDSLELMVLLERTYGIKIEDAREGRKVLTSVQTMADYIQANRQQA